MNEWSTLKKLIWLRGNPATGGSDPLTTFTGAIVCFLAKKAKPIVNLSANFTPIQDLNGQEAPYPPGGGKNKLKVKNETSQQSGGTVTFSDVGTITFSGVSVTTNVSIAISGSRGDDNMLYLPPGEYIVSCEEYGDSSSYVGINVNSTSGAYTATSRDGGRFTIAEGDYVYPRLRIGSGVTVDGITIHPMIRLASDPDATWEPYYNICPISGHTGCDIFDKAEYDAQATPTVSISFGTTVYGGQLTVFEDGSGSIKARPYYSSYNGEALVGPWVSSMDAYVPGATPTTGAQVVDMGGTETTIPLTAQQIQTLVGTNTVWVNDATGDITVQAYGTEIS